MMKARYLMFSMNVILKIKETELSLFIEEEQGDLFLQLILLKKVQVSLIQVQNQLLLQPTEEEQEVD